MRIYKEKALKYPNDVLRALVRNSCHRILKGVIYL